MRTYLLLSLIAVSTNIFGQQYNLVWSDEFDGNSLDLTNWTYDIGTGSQFGLNGWGNNESQYYTNSTNNVSVDNGMLTITARQENLGGQPYTSGRIKTLNKQYWTYGKIEARMKLPTGQGIWPAFWMLPEGQFWPGEIDIMEIIGSQPNTLHGTTHQGTVNNVISVGGSYDSPTPLPNQFHVYGIEWYEDNIKWYIDDVEYFSLNRSEVNYTEWLFAQDYYLLLNCAVGGNWPGYPDATTSFPQEFLIDYIRVYEAQPNTSTVSLNVSTENLNLAPTDVIYVSGEFNNWCSTCQPLSQYSQDYWTIDLTLEPGIHEYKFIVNGWNGTVELWNTDQSCTITTNDPSNTYINRFVNVGFEDINMPSVCFNTCNLCSAPGSIGCTDPAAANYNAIAVTDDGSCTYAASFKVNMQNSGYDPAEGVYLNGTFNNWCGTCSEMQDPDQDGIFELTVNLPVGSHEFKFTTNGWNGLIEQFNVGDSCTNTTFGAGEVWTNRVIQVGQASIDVDPYCFNTCTICEASNPDVQVLFEVDVFNNSISGAQVQLELITTNGSQTLPMDHLGWGLWSITTNLEASMNHEFRFIYNGSPESTNNECFTNNYRTITPLLGNSNAIRTCLNECELCSGCNDPLFAEYNPFAAGAGACITPIVSGCTYSWADNFNPAANIENGSCIYTPELSCPGDLSPAKGDGIVNAADLLAFLSVFGISCD